MDDPSTLDSLSQGIWLTLAIFGFIAIAGAAVYVILSCVKLVLAIYYVYKYGPKQIIEAYQRHDAEMKAKAANVGWVGRDGELHHPDGWKSDVDAEAATLEVVDRIEKDKDDTQP